MTERQALKNSAGFTLVETMVSLAIFAVALIGTLAGFVTVDAQLRDAQLRQIKMALLDAKTQKMMLTNKQDLLKIPNAWTADPTQAIVNANNIPVARPIPDPDADLSVGAYFSMLPNGDIQQLNLPAGTPCSDPAVPFGTYCREVRVTNGMPDGVNPLPVDLGGGGTGPSWTALAGVVTPLTYWTRIYRRDEDPVAFGLLYQQVVAR